MISYYYPPLADVGGLRALGFSRYLPEHGWEPFVLSVKNPDRSASIAGTGAPPPGVKTWYTSSVLHLSWITGKANGLLARVLKILRIRYDRPALRDLLCMPDEYVGWVPLTFLKGLQLIRKHGIDVVYVTCKPFSSALIGVLLKFATGKPLVLDFRDPVSPDFALHRDPYYRDFIAYRMISRLEQMVLRQADLLVLVTEDTRDLYHAFFPFIKGRTAVIYNGFLEEQFEKTDQPRTKFTIVYSGNFYSMLIPPDPWFKALQQVTAEDPRLKDRIEFLYVGSREPWLEQMVDRYGLHQVIRVTGRVPRSESLAAIARASLLLLRIVPGKVSTKLFEGLAAGVPLLALVDEGEVSRLIRRYSLSRYYIVPPGDPDAIGNAVLDAYRKWQAGLLVRRVNAEFHDEFNKKKLTADLARLLESVVLPARRASAPASPAER